MINTLKSRRTAVVTLIITCSFYVILFHSDQPRSLQSASDVKSPNIDLNISREKTLAPSSEIKRGIRRNCVKLGISTKWSFYESPPPTHLLAQKSTRIAYGANAKAGSSSFKHFLYLTEGDVGTTQLHFPDENGKFPHWTPVKNNNFFGSEAELGTYVKIVPIRNPITRLVSAFRDKQLIKFMFLKKEEVIGLSDIKVFVRFVERLFVRSGLDGIISKEEHLQPQWENLEICTFPYDIIMPMEHPEQYITVIQELSNTMHIPFPRKKPGSLLRGTTSDNRSTVDFAKEYFSSLSSVQRKAVLDHYKNDFEVFGYTKVYERGFPELKIFAEQS